MRARWARSAGLSRPKTRSDSVPRIGIFLNLFDVHIARAPIGGRVAARRYTKGRFVNASLDKASLDNERLALRVAPGATPEMISTSASVRSWWRIAVTRSSSAGLIGLTTFWR